MRFALNRTFCVRYLRAQLRHAIHCFGLRFGANGLDINLNLNLNRGQDGEAYSAPRCRCQSAGRARQRNLIAVCEW